MQLKLLKSTGLSAAAMPRATAALGAALCLAGGLAYTPAQASAGWQEISTYKVPTGEGSLLYNYTCPADAPVARSGTFENSDGSAQVFLTFSGTRLDIPSFGQWSWHFYWPAGAPAGTVIKFDAYCGTN